MKIDDYKQLKKKTKSKLSTYKKMEIGFIRR